MELTGPTNQNKMQPSSSNKINYWLQSPASFPVVLGNFRCDVTCQACRENLPRMPRAIALGSKPPPVTQIARTGLGTRLCKACWMKINSWQRLLTFHDVCTFTGFPVKCYLRNKNRNSILMTSGKCVWLVVPLESLEFLESLWSFDLRHHFMGKPLMGLQNLDCFLIG